MKNGNVNYLKEARRALAQIRKYGKYFKWSSEFADNLHELTHVNDEMTPKAWISRAFAALKEYRKVDFVLCLRGVIGKRFSQKEFARLRALRTLNEGDLMPAIYRSEGSSHI